MSDVLRLLYPGDTVRSISDRLDVSESTVRSHVKSVLHKLAVPSQLAAVATLDDPGVGPFPTVRITGRRRPPARAAA